MLSIDNLRLHLPAGFEHRADSIARLVGRELAGIHVGKSADIGSLQVPGVSVHPGQSDRQAALQIAQAIHRQVGGTVND